MSGKHLYPSSLKSGMWVVLVLLLALIVAACSNTSANTAPTKPSSGNTSSAQPVVITATTSKGSPGVGPIMTSSSPSTSGGHNQNLQQAALADRTVSIDNLSQNKTGNTTFLTIDLTITVQNTSQSTLTNQASDFQLATTGGDMIGSSTDTSSSLFGSIPAQSSLSGNISFQVPLGATNGLKLLYRPANTNETATFPLTLSA